jgi:hypothetical protein
MVTLSAVGPFRPPLAKGYFPFGVAASVRASLEVFAGLRRYLFGQSRTGRPQPALLPEPPALRMSIKPVMRTASWYPAKAIDGSLQMQIVVDCNSG